jgi:hypothetical protein
MAWLLRKDEWVVYAALLPALLTTGGIGAAAITGHAQMLWHLPAERAVCVAADDYVQGLAKRGIAKLPGYGTPADERSIQAAVIAVAKLGARNAC